jgi:hypothetical protein
MQWCAMYHLGTVHESSTVSATALILRAKGVVGQNLFKGVEKKGR